MSEAQIATGETTQVADSTTAIVETALGLTTETALADQQTTDATAIEGATTAEEATPEPENYAFNLEAHQIDGEVLKAFTDIAKELKLPKDGAQRLIDKVAPVIAARQSELIKETVKVWETQAKADKEFGGDKFAENIGIANKAYDTFGTPELKELLNKSGLSNHPEVIRTFYRAGKAMSEDTFVSGKTAPSGEKSHADRLYSS
jgi:hypothetical protein